MKKTIISTLALAAIAFGAAAQGSKNLVITDKEGQKYEYNDEKLDGVIFQEIPEYINLSHFLLGTYEETSTVGNYNIDFGTGEPDENGLPKEIGDVQVALVLTGTWSDVVIDPKLPAGYYRIGNGTQTGTFDVNKSAVWVRAEEGVDGVSPLVIVDGTIDVRTEDKKNYDIRMELTTMSGAFDFRYKGELTFQSGVSEFKPFEEDVNVEFQGGQGRFWSNWYYPFASDLAALFYKGTVKDGVLTDGYRLDISFYEPKADNEQDPEQRIADGTYSVETREVIKYTYLPYRFIPGRWTDFLGQKYITGTRLEYYDPDGSRRLGLITGGTFTVSENGTKFVFDLVTEEGIKVTGTYNRAPTIQNFCDNEEKAPKRPYSLRTEDLTLSWAQGTEAISFNDGHTILDDANTLMFLVCVPDMTRGQYLQFDVLSKNDVVSDGVYPINMSLQHETMLPGVVEYGGEDGGAPMFSWYGDLDTTDPEGYQTDLSCLASGTVTITSAANGSKHMVFDLVDDAGNKITGEFDGPITDITPDANAVKAIRKKMERKKMRATTRK